MSDDEVDLLSVLSRGTLPSSFERWRLTLHGGEERPTDADEWAGALVLVESGVMEVECAEGGRATFEEGDVLSLGWLPLRTLRNPGPGTMQLLAVRRRGPLPRAAFLHVVRSSPLVVALFVVPLLDKVGW